MWGRDSSCEAFRGGLGCIQFSRRCGNVQCDVDATEENAMRKFLFWGSVVSGVAAAYFMYRRGEGIGTIAMKATTNPVGSLVGELKGAR